MMEETRAKTERSGGGSSARQTDEETSCFEGKW